MVALARSPGSSLADDIELVLPIARVRMLHVKRGDPAATFFRAEGVFRLDICATPRRPKERARFVEHWSPHRSSVMGSIVVLPPGEMLELTSDGGPRTSLICEMRADAVHKWLAPDFALTDRRLEACLDIANATIRDLLIRLCSELCQPVLGSVELAEAITFQLSIELARYLEGVSDVVDFGGLADWRMRVIEKRLEEAGTRPTLAELATLCSLSPRQLSRAFRTSRGCSVGDYMAEKRIEAAKRRLATNESIKTIAAATGFASQSTFAYTFRRSTGVTPSQFRALSSRSGNQNLQNQVARSERGRID